MGAHCVDCVKAADRQVRQSRRIHGVKRDLPLVATGSLIAAMVTAFAYSQQSPVDVDSRYIGAREGLVGWGLIRAEVRDGEWWRMVTSAFLHVEPLHVVLAVACVALLGSRFERDEGPVRLLALFGAAAVAGALGAFVTHEPSTLSWGSAAATSGLAGAVLVRAARWDVLAMRTPAAFLVLTALFGVMSTGPESLVTIAAGTAVGLLFGAATTFKARAVDAWRTLPLLAALTGGCIYLAVTVPPGL